MSKKVLIISSSPRKGGNSEMLVSSFAKGAVKVIQGCVDCCDRCEFVDTIFASGVNSVGDIAGHPALNKAYQTGRGI